MSVLPSCAVYDSSLLDTRAGVTDQSDGGSDTGTTGGSATGGSSNSDQGGKGSSSSNSGGSGNDVGSGGVTASGGVGSASSGGATNSGGMGTGSSAGAANAGAPQGGALGTGSTGNAGAGGSSAAAGAPSGGSAGAGGAAINPCDRTKWKATASESSLSNPYNPPAYAIDGMTSTRWSTGTVQVGGEWFLLDLGARPAHLTQIVLDASTSTGDEPLKYKVEVSDDGKTFALVCTGVGAPTTTIKFVDTPARYIRITQTGSAPDANWWSIQELTLTCSPN